MPFGIAVVMEQGLDSLGGLHEAGELPCVFDPQKYEIHNRLG
jgi:hypothetical protein